MLIIKNSFFNRILDKASNYLAVTYKKSILHTIYCWLIKKIKQSYIAQWFLKPEKEIDVFESSKVVNKGMDIGSEMIEKGEKYAQLSSLRSISDSLKDEFLAKPVFVISLIILSAAIINTALWLIFRDFTIFGILLRVIIIILAFFGLRIKADYQTIRQSSSLARIIR
ncbi:MAG: hypothetical protein U9R34_06240 [Nanoarchaeota archaeon]|nr:hypothetical protein [Nanoarchaeota archaeon]